MLDSLGPRKFALPVAFIVVIACAMALAFYPIVNMEVKGLPFAVLSLDEGMVTPQGEVCAGDQMAETLVSQKDDGSSPLAWSKADSQEELDQALEAGEYYGALIIPSDYTSAMAASAANAAENPAPAVHVIIDNAKSPLVANLMQSNVTTLFSQMGIEAEVEVIHTGASNGGGGGSFNPFGSVMGQQLIVMPLYTMSVACAVFTALLTRKKSNSAKAQFCRIGVQLGVAVCLSLLVSVAVLCLANGVMALDVPLLECGSFFWIASLGIMLALIGLFDIALPLGALGIFCSFAGMACGMLPFDLLPAFWQDWVFPWAPQRFIGEGMRSILYLGAGPFNEACAGLAITGIVGLVLMCCAAPLAARRAGKTGSDANPASTPSR